MRNRAQRSLLIAGVMAAGLLALFPPYFDRSGLFGGVRLAFLLTPPHGSSAPGIRYAVAWDALALALCAAACFTLAGLIAFDRPLNRARISTFGLGALLAISYSAGLALFSLADVGRGFTAAPFLLCVIPIQYPGGYLLFWLRLALLAFLTLFAVMPIKHYPGSAIGSRVSLTVGYGSLLVLWAVIMRALLR